ncbi:Caffeic acid 3-O-methyltransferase [Vigna angularis]|uniref:Caffeic acid 3-O-methyltransferase n=1 Tax=Phaseolus angularis TaxID=3914 RepID=A0A8T0K4A9_PHAAN|nr:Caffeic acid 3-O-methyltransferase [Vigna angularis]
MYITSPSPPSLLLLTGKTLGSLGPFMTLAHDKASLRSWYQLKDAILEGGIPFNRAHGKHLFEYSDMNPSFNNLFTATMTNHATIIMNKIVESYHRHHVHFAFQKDPSSQPAFLNELATPIIGLVREMASGLVRIALKCDKDKESEKKSLRLLQESVWRTYCNGKKCGFATIRECGAKDWEILKAVEPISMGAGVLPVSNNSDGGDGEEQRRSAVMHGEKPQEGAEEDSRV